MKFVFLIILVSLKICNAVAEDFYLEVTSIGAYTTYKTMKMNNGTAIIHYENDMAWTDNFGNYGSAYCYGSFISNNEIYSKFDLYCELKNQNKDFLWSYYSRPNTEYGVGTGEAIFIDGKGEYKQLIGLSCIFSTKYFEKKIFSKTKCNITENQKRILSNMSK